MASVRAFALLSLVVLVGVGCGNSNDTSASEDDRQDGVEAQVETRVAQTVAALDILTDTPAPTATFAPTATAMPTNAPSATAAAQADTSTPTDVPTATSIIQPTTTATVLPATSTSMPTAEPSATATMTSTSTPVSLTIELPYDVPVMDVLAALNEWRLNEGLWPVQINETLNAMALDQAQYIIGLDSIPAGSDIHLDANGNGPRTRALETRYNWPYYSSEDRISIAEIAYVGANVRTAIEFWQGSSVHANTVTNTAFREVGIGAVEHPYGYLWIVVFGSRPGELPALLQPQTGLLYLSNESYRWAARSGWVQDADQYQVLSGVRSMIDDNAWQSWMPTIELPSQGISQFSIAYYDGSQSALTTVDPVRDILWIPAVVAASQAGELVLQVAGETDSPVVVAPSATPVPTTANTPIPTAVAAAAQDTLLLVYSDRSLSVVNTSSRSLDLSDVAIVSADGSKRIPLAAWDTEFATVPVSFFPPAICVQTWAWTEPGSLDAPRECSIRRSVINVSPEGLFWATDDFVVTQADTVVGTCSGGSGNCTVGLE